MPLYNREEIIKGFAQTVSKHSLENLSGTPDFILGEYLFECLLVYSLTCNKTGEWKEKKDVKMPKM